MIKRIMSFLFAATLVACIFVQMPMTAYAENSPAFKVGVFEMTSYFTKQADGEFTGYGIDFFDKLANQSDIVFEYIDTGTWQNALTMLKNGEIDILAPAQYTQQRAEEFSYVSGAIFEEHGALLALSSNDSIVFEDYKTFSKLRFGCTKGQTFEQSFFDYSEQNGFEANDIVYYNTWPELAAAVKSGQVDIAISNLMYANGDFKQVATFGTEQSFIIVQQGNNQLLNKLNHATEKLHAEFSEYENLLIEYYFPQYKVVPYTKEELEYISRSQTIGIACYPNLDPLTYVDAETGNLTGVSIDIMNKISQISGLSFQYIQIPEEGLTGQFVQTNHIALLGNMTFDEMTGANMMVTNPYYDAQYVLTGFEEFDSHKNNTIAIVDPLGQLKALVEQHFPNATIQCFDTYEDCFYAVKQHRADFAFLAQSVASRLLEKPQFYNFHVVSIPSKYLNMRLAIAQNPDSGTSENRKEETMLISILNKTIAQIGDETVASFMAAHTLDRPYKLNFSESINYYKHYIFVVVIAFFVLLTSWAYYASHMKKKNIALREAQQLAEAANKAKSSFLARMSHDMRTPMNAIIGLSSFVRDEIDDKAAVLDYVNKIDSSSQFLLGLINDILDMEKIAAHKMTLHKEPYAYTAFLDDIITMIEPLCIAKSIQFQYDYDRSLPTVYVDKVRLQQVIFNILSNAVKYTPDGGRVSYNLSADRKGDVLCCDITIADTGIGMSEAFLKKVFEPFEQESNSYTTSSQGTGLGVSIAKNLVELMGGTLQIKSELSVGTTVLIHLNLEIAANQSQPKKISTVGSSDNKLLENTCILVVEDHPLNMQITVKLLSRKGITVVEATNGKRALEIMSNSCQGRFDAILMDVRMPVMDGIEATRAIRALDRSDAKTIPIIAMTANAYDEDVEACLDAGMTEHLSKPIEPQKLYAALESYLFA